MGWLLLTCAVLGVGVAGLWSNARKAQDCHDERDHYRLSVRFWSILAGMGFVVPLLMLVPLASWGVFKTLAAQTAAVLTMIPPSILIGAGAVNAISLGRTMRRREQALAAGHHARGIVVDRQRRALSHDLMAVTFEAVLPVVPDRVPAPYRPVDPTPTRRVRLTELCPVDNWDRLEPGNEVDVVFDPAQPEHYAMLLFGDDAPRRSPTPVGSGPPLALEAAGSARLRRD